MLGAVDAIAENMVGPLSSAQRQISEKVDALQEYRVLTVRRRREAPAEASTPQRPSTPSKSPAKPEPAASPPVTVEREREDRPVASTRSRDKSSSSIVYQLEGDGESGVRWVPHEVEGDVPQFNTELPLDDARAHVAESAHPSSTSPFGVCADLIVIEDCMAQDPPLSPLPPSLPVEAVAPSRYSFVPAEDAIPPSRATLFDAEERPRAQSLLWSRVKLQEKEGEKRERAEEEKKDRDAMETPPSSSSQSLEPTVMEKSLLDLVAALVQSQREDSRETQSALMSLLQSPFLERNTPPPRTLVEEEREEEEAATATDVDVDVDMKEGGEDSAAGGSPKVTPPRGDVLRGTPQREEGRGREEEERPPNTMLGSFLQGIPAPSKKEPEAVSPLTVPLADMVRSVIEASQSLAAPQQWPAMDPDYLQRIVSEGVSSGVKEALGQVLYPLPPPPPQYMISERFTQSLGGIDGKTSRDQAERKGERRPRSRHEDLVPRYHREYDPHPPDDDDDVSESTKGKREESPIMRTLRQGLALPVAKVLREGEKMDQAVAISRQRAEDLLLSDSSSSWESFSMDRPDELAAILGGGGVDNRTGKDDVSEGEYRSSVSESPSFPLLYRSEGEREAIALSGREEKDQPPRRGTSKGQVNLPCCR